MAESENMTTEEFINDLSIDKLPDNPAAHGLKAAQVKKVYFGPLIDGLKKLLSELIAEADKRSKADDELQDKITTNTTDIEKLNGGELQEGSIANKIYQAMSDVYDSIAFEASERKSGDSDILSQMESDDEAIYKKIKEDYDALSGFIDDIKKFASGLPTYNKSTGIMTFKTLDDGTTETIDLPIEKIVDNVTLSDDGKSFVFTFHNSEPITLPVGNITLPTWVTDIENAMGDKALTPPNTEAIKNYVISKISSVISELNIVSENVSDVSASVTGINELLGTALPAAGVKYGTVIAWLTQVNGLIEGKLGITPFDRIDAGKMLLVDHEGGFAVGDYPSEGGGGSDLTYADAEEIVRQAVEAEQRAREAAFSELDLAIAAEQFERTNEFNSVRAAAIGIPTYDALTGIMTFKTLNNGTTKTIDLPIEKIVDNVTLSADGKSFVFTFHNSEPITIPVGNITLPTWVTTDEFETATGVKLLIPPNTEAVRNYIIAKIDSEATARAEADITNNEKAFRISKPLESRLMMLERMEKSQNLAYKHEIHITSGSGLDIRYIFYSDEPEAIYYEPYEFGLEVMGLNGVPCVGSMGNEITAHALDYRDGDDEGVATWVVKGVKNLSSAMPGSIGLSITYHYNIYECTFTETVSSTLGKLVDGKLDKKPFTSTDANKFVTIGSDGSLVATDLTVGGSY